MCLRVWLTFFHQSKIISRILQLIDSNDIFKTAVILVVSADSIQVHGIKTSCVKWNECQIGIKSLF